MFPNVPAYLILRLFISTSTDTRKNIAVSLKKIFKSRFDFRSFSTQVSRTCYTILQQVSYELLGCCLLRRFSQFVHPVFLSAAPALQ